MTFKKRVEVLEKEVSELKKAAQKKAATSVQFTASTFKMMSIKF